MYANPRKNSLEQVSPWIEHLKENFVCGHRNTILVLQKRRCLTAVYLVNDDDWPLWINEDDAVRTCALSSRQYSTRWNIILRSHPPKFRRLRSWHYPRLKIELALFFFSLSFQRSDSYSKGKILSASYPFFSASFFLVINSILILSNSKSVLRIWDEKFSYLTIHHSHKITYCKELRNL